MQRCNGCNHLILGQQRSYMRSTPKYLLNFIEVVGAVATINSSKAMLGQLCSCCNE